MLRVNCVDPSCFSVRVLRGMNDGVFDPELFDAMDNDACPYFPEGFNESEGANVINSDVFMDFGEGTEFAPLP